MNNQRRKKLQELAARFGDMITEKIEELETEVQEVLDDESEAYENTPESLLYTERTQSSEEAIGELENILDTIRDLHTTMYNIIEMLTEFEY